MGHRTAPFIKQKEKRIGGLRREKITTSQTLKRVGKRKLREQSRREGGIVSPSMGKPRRNYLKIFSNWKKP